MKTVDKILLSLESVFTILYLFILWTSNSVASVSDKISVLFGIILGLAFIPFIIAIIVSKIMRKKSDELSKYQYLVFIRTYLVIIVLALVGILT
jgi:uncharacterized membrane protein